MVIAGCSTIGGHCIKVNPAAMYNTSAEGFQILHLQFDMWYRLPNTVLNDFVQFFMSQIHKGCDPLPRKQVFTVDGQYPLRDNTDFLITCEPVSQDGAVLYIGSAPQPRSGRKLSKNAQNMIK